MNVTVLEGDALATLRTLPDVSAQCCVTSPPYFGLRDYGHADQMGLESSPDQYVARMVEVFSEVRRVLANDGTLWLNIGDSYAAQRGGTNMPAETLAGGIGGNGDADAHRGRPGGPSDKERTRHKQYMPARFASRTGLKHKDLLGIPWLLAFALRADGWTLRSDIIWSKPNPMPESVTDRPTKAHEYVFLLSKRARYYYDAKAIAESSDWNRRNDPKWQVARAATNEQKHDTNRNAQSGGFTKWQPEDGRNARSVWSITTQPFSGAHFATMPPELAKRCILAGSRFGDMVIDPFGGAGTTGLVADRLGRHATLIELNPQYAAMARARIADDAPLFNGDAA